MPTRLSRPWFRSRWKLVRAFNAESRGDFAQALQLMDEAAEITPLQAWFGVKRATLLLRLERVDEAYHWFDDLQQQLKDSTSPERQYLYHYCTAMLSMMQPGSNQWSEEVKQANAINCGWYVKGLLPMISADEIKESIKLRS